jgi:ligand-binding SRPBCC domain-containing protein
MGNYVLERAQIIERPLGDTFEFFSDAYNLEKITPSFLRFRILTPRPIRMCAGAVIDYELSLFGVPFRWRTLIEEWEPGRRFVDSQIKGPYALWHHTHTFEAVGPDRTLMRDRVEYRVPLGPLGSLARALFVGRMLEKIFDYRAETTARLLAPDPQSLAPSPPRPSREWAVRSGD